MALQFVFGNSGSGKTYYLYQQIIKESGEHPDKNYMVLVPEQFTMQTQKDLVLMHPQKGIMNIDVLSFVRLAHRVFEEVGYRQVPVLDDEGKNLILRRIAGSYEKNLKVLKGNIKKLGYISEIKSVISEFMQYDISLDELERIKEAAGEDTYLFYKLQDIELIYKGFCDYLKEKYITKEELLEVLSEKVEESDLLKRSTVVLDGFTGFTPVQVRLLSRLLKHCEDVIITVTLDKREDPYTYSHPYQMFGLSKHMVTTLVKTAAEGKIDIKEPVTLYDNPNSRFKGNRVLSFLEHSIFRYGGSQYPEEQDQIEIHVARNPKDEAGRAADAVRRLVREKGYRYREIGVIVSDLSVYSGYLEQAFAVYQIPFFMDQKRSILLNSFVEYIRSLIGMAEKNFSTESVLRFLRTGYAGVTHDEVDRLENYIIGLGIQGFKKWQEKWVRRLKQMDEEQLELLNHLRVQFVEKIQDFIFVLKQRSKTVRDITEALYEFLVKEHAENLLKEQENWFADKKELALAKEYSQIYGIVLELFDKFVALLGEENVSIEEYTKLLEAGLCEAKVGVIPPGIDQVVVGDVERTRIKDVKAVIFLGANDTHLPGALGQSGLLNERDREVFIKEKMNLTPGGKQKAYIQKFYLYQNLTKPTEKLILYYSKVSSDGKSIRPSYLIQEIRRLFPEISVIEEDIQPVTDREMTEKTGMELLVEGLRMQDEKIGNAWSELYTWYKKNPFWSEKLHLILESAFYKYQDGTIGEEMAKNLYGEYFEDSITRMEQFSACAFAHFLKYGLSLKERQEYEFRPLDMGNVFHSAMEKYSFKVERDQRDWVQIPEETRNLFADESVDEAITDYGNSVLYSSARNTYMVQKLKRLMRRTVWAVTKQLGQGDFSPAAYEMRFANGKIDRVDTVVEEEKVYVKVTDYKTGAKAFDVTALYHGLQLQLMVYMEAALKSMKKKFPYKEIIPSGVFYYRMSDPFVERPAAETDIELEILKELKPDGLVNLEQNSLDHLERDKTGDSLAVPVKWNKDGSLSKSSKAVDKDSFSAMTSFAGQKVKRLHKRIAEGDTQINPYMFGAEKGCEYCAFGNICGFDLHIDGYEYRKIQKLSKEEAVEKMKGEIKP